MVKKGMGLLRVKGKKRRIYARFYYLGKQREEPLGFYCSGTGAGAECKCRDHKAAMAILAEIERKIIAGMFDYKAFFPKSAALDGMGLRSFTPSITFGAYAAIWLEQQQLAFSTLKAYRSVIASKLNPFFGGMKISSIVPFHVRSFIKDAGGKPKYIKNIIGVLSTILSAARDDGIIEKNPCELVKTPQIEVKQIDALTLEEADDILKYIDNHTPHVTLFFAIGFYMGLRTGEIMGLKWEDFDFKKNKITVQRTITNGKIKNSTKTSDRRVIDIPPILDTYINNHKPKTFFKSGWVFLTRTGEPFLNQTSFTKYYWAPALQALGIRYRQMYQMRHSFASNSLAQGFPLAWVQQMLGHSTPAMIIKRYGNYIYKSEGRQGFVNFTPTPKQGLNKG